MDCCESICATIHLGHFLLMLLLPPRISERVFKDSSEVLCATGSGCRPCARLEAYDARLASGDALLGYSGLRRTAISCLVLLRALPGHAVRASYAVC